jgi:MFS family permease
VYFVGFAGIWLVFALYFQIGLGYTPLQSGLAVTPFAFGSAASAVVGGRLVAKWGRKLTITGLTSAVVGLGVTAVVLRVAPPHVAGWAVAPALLVAGIGGGWVISPNTTLTLRYVPVAMAGAAGGALQTGQRIGSAIGTAALTGVFYLVLTATGRNFPVAVSVAVGGATVAVSLALVVALVELRAQPRRPPAVEGVEREQKALPDPP